MRKNEPKKTRNKYGNAVQLVAVGGITGIFAGAIVTFYNLLAEEGEEISRGVYAYIRANPVFLPLFFLVLSLGAFFLGVIVRISPIVGGCGIPQAEGAARGVVSFRWYREATAMFAASLVSIFMGLSIGSEGPSVQIGCACGDGVATTLRRDEMIRRYQVTGGACTGLAVAANAPLTGMAFAFEEAHKRFTPEVFICSFSSVILGILTRTAIYAAFGRAAQNSFHSYIFYEMPLRNYVFVVLSALIVGVTGVAFYKVAFRVRRLFGKIRAKDARMKSTLKILIAVLLGGVFSLMTSDVMGGGHGLIESLGTFGGTVKETTESAFGLPLVWTLLVVLILKSVVTCVNVGSGIPCGIFIPIISIGACLGALLNKAWMAMGMDGKYADLMVMICMATFFTTIVKAPLTGIIMVCEFTWSFAPLLPVIIGVSVGYIIGDVSRTDGIYEELLELFEKESGILERAKKEIFSFAVHRDCLADGREVRDVLWPNGAVVTEISRGGEKILPDGDTVIRSGDVLTVVCRTENPEKSKEDVAHITGN